MYRCSFIKFDSLDLKRNDRNENEFYSQSNRAPQLGKKRHSLSLFSSTKNPVENNIYPTFHDPDPQLKNYYSNQDYSHSKKFDDLDTLIENMVLKQEFQH